ncbi:MAG: hypothetical protein R2942_11480 [Ignavibacteria bacterium]
MSFRQIYLRRLMMTVNQGITVDCAVSSQITLNDLVKEMNKLMNKDVKPLYEGPRAGDIKHSYADISLAEKSIGYKPVVSFEEELKKNN